MIPKQACATCRQTEGSNRSTVPHEVTWEEFFSTFFLGKDSRPAGRASSQERRNGFSVCKLSLSTCKRGEVLFLCLVSTLALDTSFICPGPSVQLSGPLNKAAGNWTDGGSSPCKSRGLDYFLKHLVIREERRCKDNKEAERKLNIHMCTYKIYVCNI